jgi:hypothetical protein
MQNRIFFPQLALDMWVPDGKVELAGDRLTLAANGRCYRVGEAVHVVREVTGTACPHDLVGRAKLRQGLLAMGAELMDDSMILGDNAYDVVPGWLGVPIESFDAYSARHAPGATGDTRPTSDEQMLATFILSA